MDSKNVDELKCAQLLIPLVENVTCIQCLKCYSAATSAPCGHTLCQFCWPLIRTCPLCGCQVKKKVLKLNLKMQDHTEHVVALKEAFEQHFNIKLHEFTTYSEKGQERLTNSQNQFSAPVSNSQPFTQTVQHSNHMLSKAQIHTEGIKVKDRELECVKMDLNQDDWDKIEVLAETEIEKNSENNLCPMDIEIFDFAVENDRYTTNNPRRSARNNNTNNDNPNIIGTVSAEKENTTSVNTESGKKLNKAVGNWNNVKRMKKEFSKLNKKNRNKLNVSIEMCKQKNLPTKKDAQLKSQVCNIKDNPPQVIVMDNNKLSTNNTNSNIDNIASKELNEAVNIHPSINTVNTTNNLNKVENSSDILRNLQHNKSYDNCVITKNNEKVDNINKDDKNSKVSFFKKGALLNKLENMNNTNMDTNIDNNKNNVIVDHGFTDDIEITIKIGSTVANISIKKKENDFHLKVNCDREVQTSLDAPDRTKRSEQAHLHVDPNAKASEKGIIDIDVPICAQSGIPKVCIHKSVSIPKNTASADTSTANFEIPESVEKEFDKMEIAKFENKSVGQALQVVSRSENIVNKKSSVMPLLKNVNDIAEDVLLIKDLDIFEGESLKEGHIHILKSSKNTPSEILMTTVKSKSKSQRSIKKRDRDVSDIENVSNVKKVKITQENIQNNNKVDSALLKANTIDEDSEQMNYDSIMSQVFANINADMKNLHKPDNSMPKHTQISHTENSVNKNSIQKSKHNITLQDNINETNTNKKNPDETNQKCSENIFSLLEKEDINSDMFKSTGHESHGPTQHQTTNLEDFSSGIDPVSNKDEFRMENNDKTSLQNDIDMVELSTPIEDDDKSIVEETPQKSTSFIKNRNNADTTPNVKATTAHYVMPRNELTTNVGGQNNDIYASNFVDHVISISGSLDDSIKYPKNGTVVGTSRAKPHSETPVTTMTKFIDELKCKSTPIARKSLNFNCQNVVDDPEETTCPSGELPLDTTQEKEFMTKAFEQSLNSQSQTLCAGKNVRKAMKFCIAGSCLSQPEQANLKRLCTLKNWTFVQKYTKDLTHLVVGVDDENKSQRSVKYMCALASAKWIVSYQWVEKCLQVKGPVDEEPFEALDFTGEPGPKRSRLAKQKLFKGITFYCMPPFTILDVGTLTEILEVSGGRVVNDAKSVQVTNEPSMLLAEPEHTQEDRFTYLAMELKVVPVNYEWMLNCLGSYALTPIYELLLCPDSLLPPATSKWPPELISRCYEYE